MAAGNYIVNMELVEYTDNTHNLDAEVYDVVAPNDWRYYSRQNPTCLSPIVKIRNNSKEELTSLKFTYGVSGGTKVVYDWTGSIAANDMTDITLPIADNSFWLGDDKNTFSVNISLPNGKTDEYPDNDGFSCHFNKPDLLPKNFVIAYKSNSYPQNYTISIKDIFGNEVFSRSGSNTDANKKYKDTVNLPEGCYTFVISDDNYGVGLSYWAYDAIGTGSLSFTDLKGKVLKVIEPNFGIQYMYSFSAGSATYVDDRNMDKLLNVYPNPVEKDVNISVSQNLGNVFLYLFDLNGRILQAKQAYVGDNYTDSIDMSSFAPGSYFIVIQGKDYEIKQPFVKK